MCALFGGLNSADAGAILGYTINIMRADWFSLLWERAEKPLNKLSADEFLALVRPKCRQIVTEGELKARLSSKKKLRVKLGVDATGSEIHLGHVVPLMLLRLFQRAGHDVYFVIGDFTGKIGDPSGRMEKRRELSDSDIAKNMKTYSKQISPLLDIKSAHVHKNSKWLARMPLARFFEIIGAISFGAVSQRDDFRARLKAGSPVSLREANYASLMAIDSVELKADIEVGAIDQLLNFMQARTVMSASGMRPEVALVTPLIEGTAGDGRKMSKSFGNYIALSDTPQNQFGLVMRTPDHIMLSYFLSFGDVSENEISELDSFIQRSPLEAKKQLGMLVVALIHGERAARIARDDFERKFSKKEYSTDDAIEIKMNLPAPLFDALVRAMGDDRSRSQIRRLIEERAVRRLGGDEETLDEAVDVVRDGDILKVGKLHLYRFVQK